MRKKLLVLFLCSLLGTSAAAQPKPSLPESWLDYAMEHWQLVAVAASTGIAIGIGLGLFARPAQHQKKKPFTKKSDGTQSGQGENQENDGPGCGERKAAEDAAAVVALGVAGNVLLAPDPRLETLQIENQRLRERVEEFEQRDAALERLRKEREATDNAPQSETATSYQDLRSKLKRRDSTVTKPSAVEQKKEDYKQRRGSLRVVGDVVRPEVAPTPLAEFQEREFVAPAQLTVGDRLAQLANALKQNFGHTDHAIARADIIVFLRRLGPAELHELAQNALFWDKLMYEGDGFFQYLTAEQFDAVREGFLEGIRRVIAGEVRIEGAIRFAHTERLMSAEERTAAALKFARINLAIAGLDQAYDYTPPELNKLAELVFKRFNAFIAMLSGAHEKHENTDDLRKKLVMVKEIVDVFLKAQDSRIRQMLQEQIGRFELVVRGMEQRFELEDQRIIRRLAELTAKMSADGVDDEQAREELRELLNKCSLFLLSKLGQNSLFAKKQLHKNADFWSLLSKVQITALGPQNWD